MGDCFRVLSQERTLQLTHPCSSTIRRHFLGAEPGENAQEHQIAITPSAVVAVIGNQEFVLEPVVDRATRNARKLASSVAVVPPDGTCQGVRNNLRFLRRESSAPSQR